MRPLVLVVALLAAGCSSGATLEPSGSPQRLNLGERAPFLYDTPPGGFREVRALVRDSNGETPMICAEEGVGDSDPPTCGDAELANWSWDRVGAEFSTGGIRWGVFHFYGLVDRGSFYVTGFAE